MDLEGQGTTIKKTWTTLTTLAHHDVPGLIARQSVSQQPPGRQATAN